MKTPCTAVMVACIIAGCGRSVSTPRPASAEPASVAEAPSAVPLVAPRLTLTDLNFGIIRRPHGCGWLRVSAVIENPGPSEIIVNDLQLGQILLTSQLFDPSGRRWGVVGVCGETIYDGETLMRELRLPQGRWAVEHHWTSALGPWDAGEARVVRPANDDEKPAELTFNLEAKFGGIGRPSIVIRGRGVAPISRTTRE
jgi:hypothetical protein